MTGVEAGAAAVRAGAALVRPSMSLWRWWKPPTDRASMAVWADELAAAVRSAERDLGKDLRSGPGGFVRVGFTTVSPDAAIESADVSEIATYYELIEPAPRRMVLLGEPGGGKTVAAIHLVLGLLETRRAMLDAVRAEQPVPVRVNAAGWDGTADFSGWLVTRLGLDYPHLRPAVTRKLVAEGLILPVIDGLDEMDTAESRGDSARALLDHLNATWRGEPVVVVCRTDEFERLCRRGDDNGLHGAATVVLQPLPVDRIADHLTDYRTATGTTESAWSRIAHHLRAHPRGPLATALATPWMLDLAVTAVRHDPATADRLAACPDTDAIANLLFTARIPAALTGREPKDEHRDYTGDQVRTWLRSLAARLDHRRTTGADGTAIRLDEIWEIAGTTRCRDLHGLVVGLIAALAVILAFGPTGSPVFALVYGPVSALVTGLAVTHLPAESRRLAWRVPGRSRWRGGLMSALALGPPFGLTIGLAIGVPFGLASGLAFGAAGGLAFALAVGFTGGLMVAPEDRLRITADERRPIRHSTRYALLLGATFALALGLPVALGDSLAGGLKVAFAIGLTTVLTSSVAAGRYFVATLVFRRTGAFPTRPAVFLDWARRNGLLRVHGTAYQFRHETYRQWLRADPMPGEPPS